MERCGWDHWMICESDLINDTIILSSTLFSVLVFVTFGNCELCLLPWRGCFLFLFAQIFFSADHIPVCSFTVFFTFYAAAACHITLMCTYRRNQQLCVCNQYMTCWFRKASYQSSFTHAQQMNPYNIFNKFLSGWVKIRIIISGCHAAKINNFSTKQFATNWQHISSQKNKLVTILACEGHPRSLVCSFPFFLTDADVQRCLSHLTITMAA